MSYKQSQRREDDLAIVNAGLRVAMVPAGEDDGRHWTVGDCTLVYGGMSSITVVASKTQQALIGRFGISMAYSLT